MLHVWTIWNISAMHPTIKAAGHANQKRNCFFAHKLPWFKHHPRLKRFAIKKFLLLYQILTKFHLSGFQVSDFHQPLNNQWWLNFCLDDQSKVFSFTIRLPFSLTFLICTIFPYSYNSTPDHMTSWISTLIRKIMITKCHFSGTDLSKTKVWLNILC